jgi:hypothetical protein
LTSSSEASLCLRYTLVPVSHLTLLDENISE